MKLPGSQNTDGSVRAVFERPEPETKWLLWLAADLRARLCSPCIACCALVVAAWLASVAFAVTATATFYRAFVHSGCLQNSH